MKKILLGVIVLMNLLIVACGSNGGNSCDDAIKVTYNFEVLQTIVGSSTDHLIQRNDEGRIVSRGRIIMNQTEFDSLRIIDPRINEMQVNDPLMIFFVTRHHSGVLLTLISIGADDGVITPNVRYFDMIGGNLALSNIVFIVRISMVTRQIDNTYLMIANDGSDLIINENKYIIPSVEITEQQIN